VAAAALRLDDPATFFPDWPTLDATMQRCAASYGRAKALQAAPPVSTLLAAAARLDTVGPSHTLLKLFFKISFAIPRFFSLNAAPA